MRASGVFRHPSGVAADDGVDDVGRFASELHAIGDDLRNLGIIAMLNSDGQRRFQRIVRLSQVAFCCILHQHLRLSDDGEHFAAGVASGRGRRRECDGELRPDAPVGVHDRGGDGHIQAACARRRGKVA